MKGETLKVEKKEKTMGLWEVKSRSSSLQNNYNNPKNECFVQVPWRTTTYESITLWKRDSENLYVKEKTYDYSSELRNACNNVANRCLSRVGEPQKQIRNVIFGEW